MTALSIVKVLWAITSDIAGIDSVIDRLEHSPEFKKGSICKDALRTHIDQLIDYSLVAKTQYRDEVWYKKKPHAKERLQEILAHEALNT